MKRSAHRRLLPAVQFMSISLLWLWLIPWICSLRLIRRQRVTTEIENESPLTTEHAEIDLGVVSTKAGFNTGIHVKGLRGVGGNYTYCEPVPVGWAICFPWCVPVLAKGMCCLGREGILLGTCGRVIALMWCNDGNPVKDSLVVMGDRKESSILFLEYLFRDKSSEARCAPCFYHG